MVEKSKKAMANNDPINIETASRQEVEAKISAMRECGKIHGKLFQDLREYVKPGMTGKQIDAWVRSEIVKRGAKVAYDIRRFSRRYLYFS